MSGRPVVGVAMGSDSDLTTMQAAVDALAEFDIEAEVRILSAHRTPDEMMEWARSAAGRGLAVIIAGAGGAAHLPGMIASLTPLPVIGVPVIAKAFAGLAGVDALLSIVQMPAGVPVATVAIGNARNAGLLAVRILGASDPVLRDRMVDFQRQMHDSVVAKDQRLQRGETSPRPDERAKV
jgi:5-(carboxyamino)imidazole ribonucleotide mutase